MSAASLSWASCDGVLTGRDWSLLCCRQRYPTSTEWRLFAYVVRPSSWLNVMRCGGTHFGCRSRLMGRWLGFFFLWLVPRALFPIPWRAYGGSGYLIMPVRLGLGPFTVEMWLL